jgi:hypothetical protein
MMEEMLKMAKKMAKKEAIQMVQERVVGLEAGPFHHRI